MISLAQNSSLRSLMRKQPVLALLMMGQPADLPLNRVIKCGAGGGAIPPNVPLSFEIELLDIVAP